jgi:hypothetical protein
LGSLNRAVTRVTRMSRQTPDAGRVVRAPEAGTDGTAGASVDECLRWRHAASR